LLFIDQALYSLVGLSFVVLGVVTLIRYAGFPDLTVDGSFTISAAVFAVLIKSGQGPFVGFAAAFVAGALAGLFTWSLNQLLGMGKVVSGVLSMITLLLFAPYLASGASISLLEPDTLSATLASFDRQVSGWLGSAQTFHPATISFWFLAFASALFGWSKFFRSRGGLQIRYLGSAASPTFIVRHRRKWLLLAGLALGNGLIGCGAAIEAIRRGGFSSNMGLGTLLTGLAVMILGEAGIKMFRKRDYLHVGEQLAGLITGLIAYGLLIQVVLALGPAGLDVRLATTLLLVILLGVAARAFPNSARLF
jgi:putative tryptophan/tyrosine transport system permease protein